MHQSVDFCRFRAAIGLLAVVAVLAGCAATGGSNQSVSSGQKAGAEQPPTAQDAIAVSAHPLATAAALEMLDAGGTAVDAAIATQMVLGLVEPQSSGLGGGSLLMYWDASTRKLSSLDGLAAAPAGVSPAIRFGPDGRRLSSEEFARSGRSVGVPGTLQLMQMAHQRHGRLAWARLFEPAIRLAIDGFPMPRYLHSILAKPGAEKAHAAFSELYFDPQGKVLPIGATVRNLAYAQTMRAIATEGARTWLAGEGARQIVAAVRANRLAGVLTEQDIRDYRPVEREPLCAPFLVYRVCSFAPPSFGGVVVLQMLQMLEARAPQAYAFEDSDFSHVYAEAGRLAQAERRRWIGDPDHVRIPLEGLLAPAYLRARSGLINPKAANPNPKAGEPVGAKQAFVADDHDPVSTTSQIAIADHWGNVVSITTTINLNFGSRIPAAGFVLNNVLTNFSTAAVEPVDRANAMRPGKRPITSMSPTLVFDAKGEPVVAGGSAGGGPIVDYIASALIDLLAAGRTPEQALARGHLTTALQSKITLEKGTAAAAQADRLRALGHDVRVAPLTSGLGFIQRRESGWIGAADPRRDGNAGIRPVR
jgi:gamma-glutamyltranspeptidase/glutathione hydrolase